VAEGEIASAAGGKACNPRILGIGPIPGTTILSGTLRFPVQDIKLSIHVIYITSIPSTGGKKGQVFRRRRCPYVRQRSLFP
jgi:hypothetical protein